MKAKIAFLIFIALTIAFVGGIVVYTNFFMVSKPNFTQRLSRVVPAEMEGWQVEDVPLGETKGMIEHVKKTLRFDECVSRVYKKNGLQITFYAAYWLPGTRTPVDAGGHNPDSCWVNFGWKRTVRDYSIQNCFVGKRRLRPFEYGVYEKKDSRIPVFFWHLLNGAPHAYKDRRDGWKDGWAGVLFRLPKRIEDFKRFGLNQRREQLFVRISFENQHIEEVLKNPDFVEFMNKLAPLGIFTDAGWGAAEISPPPETVPADSWHGVAAEKAPAVAAEPAPPPPAAVPAIVETNDEAFEQVEI